jgi:hypothetical protein
MKTQMDEWQSLETKMAIASVRICGVELRVGNRVRLKPKANGDAFDIFLRDKIAVIAAIEQDFEDRLHLAVVVEEDPASDFGFQRQIAHRFFFAVDEVEPLAD